VASEEEEEAMWAPMRRKRPRGYRHEKGGGTGINEEKEEVMQLLRRGGVWRLGITWKEGGIVSWGHEGRRL
jgi:hypothetical protein